MYSNILKLPVYRKKLAFFLMVVSVLLSACNGGGTGDPPPEGSEQNKAQLSVNTKVLDYGAVAASQTLTISNSGGEILRWQIGWLNQGIQPAWVVSVGLGTVSKGPLEGSGSGLRWSYFTGLPRFLRAGALGSLGGSDQSGMREASTRASLASSRRKCSVRPPVT